MTNFDYYNTVPATDDNPSQDQPLMLINTVTNQNIWNIDHIGPSLDNGGTHTQTSYADYKTNPVFPSQSANHPSVAYPDAGVADVNNPQYYFKNTNATFPLSAIKSFGVFSRPISPATPSISNGFNVMSIALGTSNVYIITLKSDVVSGNNIAVFLNTATPTTSSPMTWMFTNPVLTINTGASVGPYSFVILQI